MSVEQTSLPRHLACMVQVLTGEDEAGRDEGGTGPCMEYMLQHGILETLYTLARTDVSTSSLERLLSTLNT